MHILLAAIATTGPTGVNGSTVGTAQDLTFGIPIGVFWTLAIILLFWLRTGHERAHRRQALRRAFRDLHERGRLPELEQYEPAPTSRENLPR